MKQGALILVAGRVRSKKKNEKKTRNPGGARALGNIVRVLAGPARTYIRVPGTRY